MESLLSMTKTTPHLALSLNSHIIEGLSEDQIKRNGKYYGRNIKSVEKSYKCARLKEIVIEEIMSGWFVLVIVITIAQFVCGLFWVHSEFKSNAVAVLVFATIVALLHCTSEYWIAIKSH